MKRNAGFGLTEVVISMGVMSIMILGTMAMMQNSLKSQRNATLSSDFNQMVSDIRAVLNNETYCTNGFQGLAYPVGQKAGTPVPEVRLNSRIIAKVNALNGGLKTTQLALAGIPIIPKDVEAIWIGGVSFLKLGATLNLEVAKTGESIGAKTLQKDFQMTVLVDSTSFKIRGCYGEISKTEIVSEAKAQLKQELCTEMKGAYDPNTAKCSVANPTPAQVVSPPQSVAPAQVNPPTPAFAPAQQAAPPQAPAPLQVNAPQINPADAAMLEQLKFLHQTQLKIDQQVKELKKSMEQQ